MHNLDSTLLCLEMKSVALGYRALKMLCDNPEIRILEASRAGERFLILALGDHNKLRDNAHSVRLSVDGTDVELWHDQELVEEVEPQLLNAIYHLPSHQAEGAVIVVECHSLSAVLSISQLLLQSHQLKIIELKIYRNGLGAHAFFTGPVELCGPAAEDARTKLRSTLRAGRVELLENLSKNFRQFFNLNGLES